MPAPAVDRRGRSRERRAWTAAYVGVLLLPLALMLRSPHQEGSPSTVFAVSLGFVAYMAMALQVVLASRSPVIARAAGADLLLRLHRYMGSALLVFVTLHVFVLAYKGPWFRPWLYPLHGPFVAQAGFVATLALLLIAVTSIWRRRLGIGFERWRQLHIGFTIVAMSGAYVHVLLASDYSWSTAIRVTATAAVLLALGALIYLRLGRAFAATGRPYELVEVRRERGAATTLRLAAVDHAGIRFRPGQFAWLRVHGRAYTLTEHPLSVASSTHDPAFVEFTAKEAGDHTSQFGSLAPGTVVLVDGPHGGHQPPLPDAGYVLVVAGIGITPAMSTLRTFADRGDRRPLQLIYGCRDWDDITFREELDSLRDRLDLDVVQVLSRPTVAWSGPRGRIDSVLLDAALPADRAQRNYLVCGPAGFPDRTFEYLVGLGVAPSHVQAERFDSV